MPGADGSCLRPSAGAPAGARGTALGFLLAATLLAVSWAAGPVEEEVDAAEASRALLHVPGISPDVRARLWQLRQAGDAGAFLVGLLASIVGTVGSAASAANVALLGSSPLALAFKAVEVWEAWRGAESSGRSTAGQKGVDAGLPGLGLLQADSAQQLLGKLSTRFKGARHFEAPLWMVVRDTGNRQDYCAVAEDIQSMWSWVRPGGFMVLHGGIRADVELRCANGSMISGGVRAAAEDFLRGTPGIAGLAIAEGWIVGQAEAFRGGQSLPRGLGRVVFPDAEAPYWLLRKASSEEEDLEETGEVPMFASPASHVDMSLYFKDELDERLFELLRQQLFADTEQYWQWITALTPELTSNEIYQRVIKLISASRQTASVQRIPRLLHQVYGFKCTNWDTGLWEPTCVDEATFDIPHKQLEECFQAVLPFNRTELHEKEAEIEWSWTVMQQVFNVCCDKDTWTRTAEQQAPVHVYSASRGVMLDLTMECSLVTPRCCKEAGRVQEQRRPEPGTLRDDFLRWSLSWRRHHPEWKYVMWGPMEVKRLVYEHYPWLVPVVNGYPSWIYRSDAAQWIILHHFGGIYASMDVEALRPIDYAMIGHALPKTQAKTAWSFVWAAEGAFYDGGVSALLNEDGVLNNFMSEEDDGQPVRRLDIHVVGTIAGHPLFREMLNTLKVHQYEFVLTATGNERFTAEVYEKGFFNAVGLRILSREAYNPLDWSNTEMRRRCFREDCADLFPGCFGIHHHANSWFGLRSEQVSTGENWTTAALKLAGSENKHCWGHGITAELCCDVLKYGAQGNIGCWDEIYTFEGCCR